MPNEDTKNGKEQHPEDDLKSVEQLDKLKPEHSKGVSRVNGVIAIIAGIGFLCVAIGCDCNVIFRILPLIGGIGFIAMGVARLRGDD